MRAREVNLVSSLWLAVMSVTTALTTLPKLISVFSGDTRPQYSPAEEAVGTIFSLSIMVLVPMIVLFLATADWTQPGRVARRLAVPIAALCFAFGVLYSV
jgi:hypothetical protein